MSRIGMKSDENLTSPAIEDQTVGENPFHPCATFTATCAPGCLVDITWSEAPGKFAPHGVICRNEPVGKCDVLGEGVFVERDDKNKTFTLHLLIMYHSAPGENVDVAACARLHQQILQTWFDAQTKNWKFRVGAGGEYSVKLHPVIATSEQIPPIPQVLRPDVSDPDYEAKTAAYNRAYDLRRAYESKAGFFYHVELTQDISAQFTAGMIPVSDPGHPWYTYEEMLAHELMGHGLGNPDEYNIPELGLMWSDWYTEAAGRSPDADSLMCVSGPAMRGQRKLYRRHLFPTLAGKHRCSYVAESQRAKDFLSYSLKQIHRFGDLTDHIYGTSPGDMHEELLRILGRTTP